MPFLFSPCSCPLPPALQLNAEEQTWEQGTDVLQKKLGLQGRKILEKSEHLSIFRFFATYNTILILPCSLAPSHRKLNQVPNMAFKFPRGNGEPAGGERGTWNLPGTGKVPNSQFPRPGKFPVSQRSPSVGNVPRMNVRLGHVLIDF